MDKKLQQSKFDKFRPSDYMRARRPELFSDSPTVTEYHFTRELLEYHLDTLTSRKQEYEFEHFARRLAEKELCPNLLPQTGPTGGGDSKTDTETYPVADAISLRWYEGIGREAAQERWAFAFSTKKDWLPKVRGDIDKIVQTKRGYNLVYFVSNQFIKDKKRAEVEDELSKKHCIQVHILDRNWIVKCVLEHNRQQLAVETLGLSQHEERKCHTLGPQDTLKESQLKELEDNISNVDRYKDVEYQLAEDCMQAALLARNLERPRHEVDGRFDRAERVAVKVGYRQQKMRISYIRTWTAFYWYDDINELNEGYSRVEGLAIGSEQYEDIGKLANLWMLLATTVKLKQLDATQAQFDKRTTTLKSELIRLASEKERPNNALQAKIRSLLINLFESFGNDAEIDHILDKLHETIKTSQGYLDFPFEFISEIFPELNSLFPDNKKIDEIFETLVQLADERTSQGSAGGLLLNRGYGKLREGKKYEAIKLFSRAQEKLLMDEYRKGFVDSLMGCALAYESAGLLWAARRNVLVAANEALREFWKHGNVVSGTLYYLQKLIWLELQLGRIPYALSWMDLASVVAEKLISDKPEKDRFVNDRQIQDLILGLLLLKAELSDLQWLDFLPCVLESKGLVHSWMAIIYALGHEEYLREEKVIPSDQSSEEVLDFFDKWLIQPASRDIPEKPELLQNSEVILSTFIIGCHLTIETTNCFESLCLSETLLAVLEAFLATGLDRSILPYQPELQIRIKSSDSITNMFKYWLDETAGIPTIEIRHKADFAYKMHDQSETYREWLREVMIFVLCQITVIDNPQNTLETMAKEGAVFSRALSIVDTDVCIKNMLGSNPKFCLWAWRNQDRKESFPLKRSTPWFNGRIPKEENKSKITAPESIKEVTFDKLSGIDNLKHRDVRVYSIINMPLWDKAKWQAMAYVGYSDEPPLLVLGFRNQEAGKAIFRAWQSRFGKVDENDYIRVSFITGIDTEHLYNYNVIIGVDTEFLQKHTPVSHAYMVSRVHRMEPSTPHNLQQFLSSYSKAKSYVLAPGLYEELSKPPTLFPELGIKKRKLRVCQAWQIDKNDPDMCALFPGIKPIIPDGINDPPVNRAIEYLTELEELRNRRK